MIEIRYASGQDVQKEYNKLYQDSMLYHKVDGYYKWLVGLLHPKAGYKLLDIACGEGQILKYALRTGLQAYGVDISAQALQVARQNAPQAQLDIANGEHLPYPDDAFDYVTSIGSLEHYESPRQGAREIARVLRPGGIACILVPNTYSLFGNITRTLRTGNFIDDGQPIQRYGTRLQWVTLLEQNGLSVRKIKRHHQTGPYTRDDWIWYMCKPRRWFGVILQYLTPLNLTSSFVFLCSKKRTGLPGE